MNTTIKIVGSIEHIGKIQNVSDKFMKRQLVIKTDEKYPQTIDIQLTQDKCHLADHLNFGDFIECSVNIRGREWIGKDGVKKWFNTIEAWQIALARPTSNFAEQTQQSMATKSEPSKPTTSTSDFMQSDEMPF